MFHILNGNQIVNGKLNISISVIAEDSAETILNFIRPYQGAHSLSHKFLDENASMHILQFFFDLRRPYKFYKICVEIYHKNHVDPNEIAFVT